MTFQWLRTPLGKSSGHVSDKQRPQRPPNTLEHSGNTGKTPITGLGTFGTVHERLDPSVRSPRNPILLGAAVGASVPSLIFFGYRGRHLTSVLRLRLLAESSDSHYHFPDSFPRTSRLGNNPLRLREVRFLMFVCLRVLR
ncbi:hypothetical protein CRG98_039923 [Punica granatum]|uniref:Uncharacterized protein n=1 Tax=Punica granatum TaxID=22663 RepID=A0A2I0I7P6_PUNGR|nr:hypothetical protein CRG98_039923 [Punica granatum]